VNRLYVQDGIYNEFVEKFSRAVAALKVGNGMEEGADIGPLINKKGLDKVQLHVDDALAKGARVEQGGKPMEGLFYQPTVLSDVNASMLITQDEVFGPVAPVIRFKTEEEVIAMANESDYGLASYFYSRDIARCWRVAEALEAGMVGINEGMISTAIAPFGGVKESGIGREGSKYGMDYFMEIKYLCFGNIK
jgi:succinate-semialdehyde dehydrogenase/glutarate-semialdehyde dehydrogenase